MANVLVSRGYEKTKSSTKCIKRECLSIGIRQSQEAVELSLKALLRIIGIEPPKWHDVGPILVERSKSFPKWFKDLIPELAAISRWLRREREPSMMAMRN